MKNEKSGNRSSVISNQVTGKLITSALICVLLSALICVFTFPAYAEILEVTVTSGGDWTIGSISSSDESISGPEGRSGDKWTILGSPDGVEDIRISVDGTFWHPAASPTTDYFVLRHDGGGSWSSDAITTDYSDTLLFQALVQQPETGKFDLKFTPPTDGHEGTTEELTVTLTASNWQAPDPWYLDNGPSGADLVVKIGNMYVAKWINTPGTDNDAAKPWADACSWATALEWLDKTDWYLPAQSELQLICFDRGKLGTYHSNVSYWSSSTYGSKGAYLTSFVSYEMCRNWNDHRNNPRYVRAVRPSQ